MLLGARNRRNRNRRFRDVKSFSQISTTCQRLSQELHNRELSAQEQWDTVLFVCTKHIQLETFLLEAEAGMKSRISVEKDNVMEKGSIASSKSRVNRTSRFRFRGRTDLVRANKCSNYEMVDKFLEKHVTNVRKLGDEVRLRILSGIGSAFSLATRNQSAVMALAEAVEVYERAAEQHKLLGVSNGTNQARTLEDGCIRLRLTGMRAAALARLYQDIDTRSKKSFEAVNGDVPGGKLLSQQEGKDNPHFTEILRACANLVTEIRLAKMMLAPCFDSNWHVEYLWTSCVARVCSRQVLRVVGGPNGSNLPDFTVTQLLDLVALVEFFRETVLDACPQVSTVVPTKTYFDAWPDLFTEDKRNVNVHAAANGIAWVNNMLWEIRHLAVAEILLRTRTQMDAWLENVYHSEYTKNPSTSGRLTTSYCEDVFSLASAQLRTIREHLSPKSDVLGMAICVIFSRLRVKQIHCRDDFLKDLESCCAAANDFARLSERSEEIIGEFERECEFTEDSLETSEAGLSELVALYSNDAVFAAQSVHIYVFEPIDKAVAKRLFGFEWEQHLTHNELALTLTRTLEDFMGDLEKFLDDWMLRKSVDALLSASVVFYVRCLLVKAKRHSSLKVPCFHETEKALKRMNGDITIMRNFFEGLVPRMPALCKVIEREFEVLTTLLELLSVAAGISRNNPSDFILVLHKRVRDVNLTKNCVCDLWHLVAPTEELSVWELVESMERDLNAVACEEQNVLDEAQSRSYVPGLRVDEMMAKLYAGRKRKRPVKLGPLETVVGYMEAELVRAVPKGW